MAAIITVEKFVAGYLPHGVIYNYQVVGTSNLGSQASLGVFPTREIAEREARLAEWAMLFVAEHGPMG
jgi:hypothetical protein